MRRILRLRCVAIPMSYNNRWKGQRSRSMRPVIGQKLSVEQELAVCHYLNRLDQIGAAARRPMLTHCANAILRRSHDNTTTSAPTVGPNWPRRFLTRHPEYQVRKQKPLVLERKNAHDPGTIQCWFEGYLRLVTEKGITPADTYNVNETGFRMGVRQNQWIITRDHSRQAYLASSNNREMMTCVETISGDGLVLPPMFIFAAAQHMEHWFTAEIDDNVLFAVSETGYINDKITLQWLKHFEQHTRQRQNGAWRLLVLDGYGSHCTVDFVTFCDRHKIVPLCFPPHATHLMQPLDVVVFAPYKHYHSEAVDTATRT